MLSIVKSHSKSLRVHKNCKQSSKFTDTVKFTVPDLTVNGERLGCEQTATPHLIVAASAYISLVRCSRPKESPQFDETIENSVVWRKAFSCSSSREVQTKTGMRRTRPFSTVSSN